MPTGLSPAQAWQQLKEGNTRFVNNTMEHPSQGFDRREELRVAQHPVATFFGCSDSRVAAEIIFDQGLGDLFVVRTAGHVLDTTVIGSIEYAVEILRTPLIVVLGHDSCGAVQAATDALRTGVQPPGMVRAVTDRVIPSIVAMTTAEGGLSRCRLMNFVGCMFSTLWRCCTVILRVCVTRWLRGAARLLVWSMTSTTVRHTSLGPLAPSLSDLMTRVVSACMERGPHL